MNAANIAGGGTSSVDVEAVHAGERCPSCGALVEESWLTCAACGGPLAAPAELPGGALVGGRYRIVRVLGRGGFGITYEAFDPRLERRVAIKELFPDSVVRHRSMVLAAPRARPAFREAKERFLQEARVLARFTHPGIVRVYEVFEEHNTAYLVMELLEGRTLSDLLRQRGRPFSEAEALDVAARVAGALEEVHAVGVLHRDINPSNVVLTSHGRIVLIDFGIARRFDRDTGVPLTRAVTPGYAPPEQYAGNGKVGPASDVYGLAATLYRLLSGCTPTAAIDREQGVTLEPLHRSDAAVNKTVSDAVLDGLELDPRHRPQSMGAFVNRLGLAGLPLPQRSVLLEAFAPPARPGVAVGDPRVGTVAPPIPAPRNVDARPPVPRVSATPPTPPAPVPRQPAPAPTHAPGPPLGGPTRAATPMPAPPAPAPPPPLAVRRPPPGRSRVTVPVGIALALLASATPVLIVPLLVVVALPVLATWGDVIVHEYRLDHGDAFGWWQRLPAGGVAPVLALRNIGLSILRAIPALLLLIVTVAAGWLARSQHVMTLHDLVVRAGGGVAGLVVVVTGAHGSPRFRTSVAVDRVVQSVTDERGRPLIGAWVLWIAVAAIGAFGLWLTPELWPF